MSIERLRTKLWVQAQIKLCDLGAIPIAVMRRGDPDAGAVLLKVNDMAGGFRVLGRMPTDDGGGQWSVATGVDPVEESQADDYLVRQTRYDPDLWVLEIEDAHGRYDAVLGLAG